MLWVMLRAIRVKLYIKLRSGGFYLAAVGEANDFPHSVGWVGAEA